MRGVSYPTTTFPGQSLLACCASRVLELPQTQREIDVAGGASVGIKKIMHMHISPHRAFVVWFLSGRGTEFGTTLLRRLLRAAQQGVPTVLLAVFV